MSGMSVFFMKLALFYYFNNAWTINQTLHPYIGWLQLVVLQFPFACFGNYVSFENFEVLFYQMGLIKAFFCLGIIIVIANHDGILVMLNSHCV